MRQGIFWYSGIFLLIVICLLSTPTLAHVPVFEENDKSSKTIFQIEDPSKSRVFYGQLTSGDFRYYSFKMEKGERIVLGLTIPIEKENQGFAPNLILIGPGLVNEGKVQEKLEVPEGYGAKVLSYNLPESSVYEGFTPSAFYSLVHLDIKAPESGIYYAAISSILEKNSRLGSSVQEKEIHREGNYGLILGYKETFTLKEWISIPLSQIKIYRWEGQSPFLIFTPLALTLTAGLLAIFFKREDVSRFNPACFSGILAGLFFLGTGMSYIFQMLISLSKSSYSSEVFITFILIFVSVGLGVVAIALSLKDGSYSTGSARKRLYFFGLGIAGLLFWAGLLIGPLLAFEAAVLPWKRKR